MVRLIKIFNLEFFLIGGSDLIESLFFFYDIRRLGWISLVILFKKKF